MRLLHINRCGGGVGGGGEVLRVRVGVGVRAGVVVDSGDGVKHINIRIQNI